MYSIKQLLNGFREPKKIVREIETLSGKVQNNARGCAVMSEDWDNLLILDACRYDMFERLCSINGRLEHRRSKGSATREFARNNFAEKEYFDTVYVNGNPNVSLFASDTFHRMDDVWRTDWNADHGTVMPNVMKRSTLAAAREFPNKRLVAHFMQPHHPFLGPTAMQELGDLGGNEARADILSDRERTGSESEDGMHVWARFERGEIEMATIRRAYDETLLEALPHVASLCETLAGKTVVTADHGNLLGEQAHPYLPWATQRFAHPDYATATELLKVPWLVRNAESRREITADPPEESRAEYDENVVDARLESLGYK